MVEEGNLDVQLQLKKCSAVDEQHARAISKIEKDFAQVGLRKKKGFTVSSHYTDERNHGREHRGAAGGAEGDERGDHLDAQPEPRLGAESEEVRPPPLNHNNSRVGLQSPPPALRACDRGCRFGEEFSVMRDAAATSIVDLQVCPLPLLSQHDLLPHTNACRSGKHVWLPRKLKSNARSLKWVSEHTCCLLYALLHGVPVDV